MYNCDFEVDDVEVWPGQKRSRVALQERERSQVEKVSQYGNVLLIDLAKLALILQKTRYRFIRCDQILCAVHACGGGEPK